ncbi:MAG: hypothetical protein LBJ47_07600, partial [Tannerella sp.]|nr:hypothetical protein [Tannerella sp.]
MVGEVFLYLYFLFCKHKNTPTGRFYTIFHHLCNTIDNKTSKMKRIKIFVASSAELDQDKTLFDLFISDKNKIYRERYIDFELRTWKDFVSAITLTRLQEKYNEYIQSCDIVVFLFHTRVGQYTLEEFEIAHRQFIRSKGKKPLIYVYFKDYAGAVKIP